jgi:hypothetical protein
VAAASSTLKALTVLRVPAAERVKECEPGDQDVVPGLAEQPRDVDGLAPGPGVDPAHPVGLAGDEALADVGDVQGGVQRGADHRPAAGRGHWPV